MGGRLESQRRGRGGHTFRATKNRRAAVYPRYEGASARPCTRAQVVDLLKDSGRNTVLAELFLENEQRSFVPACEGLAVGQSVEIGAEAELCIGNIIPVGSLPEGCPVFNLERVPGDGGTLLRASGVFAQITAQDVDKTRIKLASGKEVRVPKTCRATVGCASGGERTVKPFVKAGAKHYYMLSKSRMWPRTRGVAKNAGSHPHGGEQHHVGRSKSVRKGAPPGRKVGSVGAKRSGRRKK